MSPATSLPPGHPRSEAQSRATPSIYHDYSMTAIPAPCGSNKQQSVRIGQSAWASVELIPPHSLSGIERGSGGNHATHYIYCVLLIATWLCSTASVVWVLVASFVSSVALVEEL